MSQFGGMDFAGFDWQYGTSFHNRPMGGADFIPPVNPYDTIGYGQGDPWRAGWFNSNQNYWGGLTLGGQFGPMAELGLSLAKPFIEPWMWQSGYVPGPLFGGRPDMAATFQGIHKRALYGSLSSNAYGIPGIQKLATNYASGMLGPELAGIPGLANFVGTSIAKDYRGGKLELGLTIMDQMVGNRLLGGSNRDLVDALQTLGPSIGGMGGMDGPAIESAIQALNKAGDNNSAAFAGLPLAAQGGVISELGRRGLLSNLISTDSITEAQINKARQSDNWRTSASVVESKYLADNLGQALRDKYNLTGDIRSKLEDDSSLRSKLFGESGLDRESLTGQIATDALNSDTITKLTQRFSKTIKLMSNIMGVNPASSQDVTEAFTALQQLTGGMAQGMSETELTNLLSKIEGIKQAANMSSKAMTSLIRAGSETARMMGLNPMAGTTAVMGALSSVVGTKAGGAAVSEEGTIRFQMQTSLDFAGSAMGRQLGMLKQYQADFGHGFDKDISAVFAAVNSGHPEQAQSLLSSTISKITTGLTPEQRLALESRGATLGVGSLSSSEQQSGLMLGFNEYLANVKNKLSPDLRNRLSDYIGKHGLVGGEEGLNAVLDGLNLKGAARAEALSTLYNWEDAVGKRQGLSWSQMSGKGIFTGSINSQLGDILTSAYGDASTSVAGVNLKAPALSRIIDAIQSGKGNFTDILFGGIGGQMNVADFTTYLKTLRKGVADRAAGVTDTDVRSQLQKSLHGFDDAIEGVGKLSQTDLDKKVKEAKEADDKATIAAADANMPKVKVEALNETNSMLNNLLAVTNLIASRMPEVGIC